MITCDFSKRGSDTLSHFLYKTIKEQILLGNLASNEKLPSKRELASHLGVSVITIQGAYENLIDEGYIYSIEKKGFFVENIAPQISFERRTIIAESSHNPLECAAPVEHNVPERVHNPQECAYNPHCAVPPETPAEFHIADFAQNNTSAKKFPFSTWAKVSRCVLSEYGSSLIKSQPSFGAVVLRKAIAKHLKNFKNMDVDFSQIVIGAGTETLYSFVYQLLGSDIIYALENPGYPKTGKVLSSIGAKCVYVDLDGDGISVDNLEKSGASAVHVTPSHHFPTGIVMPVRRRFQLLHWASSDTENKKYIIEDDYDSEFRFTGNPIEPLFNLDNGGHVIYMNTFSKTLSPAFRISFMVLPKNMVPVMEKKLGFYSCTVSSFEQWTLARFMDEGHFAKHITRMKNYYRSLRNEFIQALKKSSIGQCTHITEQNSGLHFLLTVDKDCAALRGGKESIRLSLQERGVNVPFLDDYTSAPIYNTDVVFLINYSALEKEKIPSVISALEKSLGEIPA